MDNKPTIGEVIKAWREAHIPPLSIQALAKLCGKPISAGYLSTLERSNRVPRPETLARVAGGLGIETALLQRRTLPPTQDHRTPEPTTQERLVNVATRLEDLTSKLRKVTLEQPDYRFRLDGVTTGVTQVSDGELLLQVQLSVSGDQTSDALRMSVDLALLLALVHSLLERKGEYVSVVSDVTDFLKAHVTEISTGTDALSYLEQLVTQAADIRTQIPDQLKLREGVLTVASVDRSPNQAVGTTTPASALQSPTSAIPTSRSGSWKRLPRPVLASSNVSVDPDLTALIKLSEGLDEYGLRDLHIAITKVVETEMSGGNSARNLRNLPHASTLARDFANHGVKGYADQQSEGWPEISGEGEVAAAALIPLTLTPQDGISKEILDGLTNVGGLISRGDHFIIDSAVGAVIGILGLALLGRLLERIGPRKDKIEDELALPTYHAVQSLWGPHWQEALFDVCFRLATAWPVHVDRLSATEVYFAANRFYRQAESESFTFSTSSGLIVPIEFLGRDEFQQTFPSVSLPYVETRSKNPFRRWNFEAGILADDFPGVRYYQYDEIETSLQLVEGYNALQDDADKARYRAFAEHLLARTLSKPNVELTAAPGFDWIKRRMTRNSPTEQMVSFRTSGSIAHAITFSRSALNRGNWLPTALGWSLAASAGARHAPLLFLAGAVSALPKQLLDEYLAAFSIEERYARERSDGLVRTIKRTGEVLGLDQAAAEIERLLVHFQSGQDR